MVHDEFKYTFPWRCSSCSGGRDVWILMQSTVLVLVMNCTQTSDAKEKFAVLSVICLLKVTRLWFGVFQIVHRLRHTCPSPGPAPRLRRRRSCWRCWRSSPSSSNLNICNTLCFLKPSAPRYVYMIQLFVSWTKLMPHTLFFLLYGKLKDSFVFFMLFFLMKCSLNTTYCCIIV